MKRYVIDKEYLTFQELVQRWGFSEAEVHHLIASERLVPSMVWNGLAEVCTLESPISRHGFTLVPCSDSNDGMPSTEFPRGWMYLRLPKIVGAHDKYYFVYATRDARPVGECCNPGSWYRLLGDDNRTHRVDALAIEREAVFMSQMVESCEATFQKERAVESDGKPIDQEGDDRRSAKVIPSEGMLISGKTFSRLQKAVEAFALEYPDYAKRPPKLDGDVRKWLKDSKLAINDAEKRVFGTILFEHFDISGDTLKRP